MDMPEKTQPRMPLKVKNLCDKYNLSSMILNMNNSKTFTSHIVENTYKASTEHQLTLKKVTETELLQYFQNRHQNKLNF